MPVWGPNEIKSPNKGRVIIWWKSVGAPFSRASWQSRGTMFRRCWAQAVGTAYRFSFRKSSPFAVVSYFPFWMIYVGSFVFNFKIWFSFRISGKWYAYLDSYRISSAGIKINLCQQQGFGAAFFKRDWPINIDRYFSNLAFLTRYCTHCLTSSFLSLACKPSEACSHLTWLWASFMFFK